MERQNTGGGTLWEFVTTKFSFRGWIGMIVVLGSMYIATLAFFKAVPQINDKLVYMIVGYILAKFGTVVDWNFGGSKVADDRNKVDAVLKLDKRDE